MTQEQGYVDIKEMVYNPEADTLVVWLVEEPGETMNRETDEGRFVIVKMEDPTIVVGMEVINFSHYASVHGGSWRSLADALSRFRGGGPMVWYTPGPGAGLQELIPA